MKFDDYWKSLVAKNPALAVDENVMRISVANFRKSLKQAHEKGGGDESAMEKILGKLGKGPLGL
jgi:hypothetical protein